MMEVVMEDFQALVAREEPGDPRPQQVIGIERLINVDLPEG
jgi:hypothetical protein